MKFFCNSFFLAIFVTLLPQETSPTPAPVVETRRTPCNANGPAPFLDRHKVLCDPDQGLTAWKLTRAGCSGEDIRIEYKCEKLTTPVAAVNNERAQCQATDGPPALALQNFTDIDCSNSGIMQGFQMRNACGGNRRQFDINCAVSPSQPQCTKETTECQYIGDKIWYLDRQSIECPEGSFLSQWQLEKSDCAENHSRFRYTCCILAPVCLVEKTIGAWSVLKATSSVDFTFSVSESYLTSQSFDTSEEYGESLAFSLETSLEVGTTETDSESTSGSISSEMNTGFDIGGLSLGGSTSTTIENTVESSVEKSITESETLGTSRETSKLIARSIQNAVEVSQSISIEQSFPPGTLWVFRYAIKDSCGGDTSVTSNSYAITNSLLEPPCCLPGLSVEADSPRGPCLAGTPNVCEQKISVLSDALPDVDSSSTPASSSAAQGLFHVAILISGIANLCGWFVLGFW